MSKLERFCAARWESTQPEVTLMRLTIKTDLAAQMLMAFAVNEGITQRTANIARSFNASAKHRLKEGNALQTIRFVESPCGRCGRLRGCLALALEDSCQELDMVTLDDHTKRKCGLGALLAVPDNMRRACAEVALA